MDPALIQPLVDASQPHPVTVFVRSIVDLGPFTMYILIAYAAAFMVSALLVILALTDEASQRRALAVLEARGIRRRSDAARDAQQKAAQS